MVEDILNLKKFLMDPKRSDNFDTWYYLDGWRIKQLKEELNKLYWYAARCDASRIAHEEGRKKRKVRWEQKYI